MPYQLTQTERLKYWEQMELSTRTTNCLVMNGIDSVEELMRYDNTQLLRMPNFGRISLRELREWLSVYFKPKFDVALANYSDAQLLDEIARRLRGRLRYQSHFQKEGLENESN